MFGIWKRKDPEVVDYKFAQVMDFETSATEFYDGVEQDLAARRLTGLVISRIDYTESGVLGAKRMYLRMRRERLVFDVCAAPFGTDWFFSYRFSIIHCQLMLWEIIVILFLLAGVVWFYASLFGLILGSILFAASLLSLLLLMRNTVSLGFQDLDSALLQIPIVGTFYEVFLRKSDSYYLQDTRLAYMNVVRAVVEAKVDDVTKAQGIEGVKFVDATPVSHPKILRSVADLLSLKR